MVLDLGTDRWIDSLNDDGVVVGYDEKPGKPVRGFVLATNSGEFHDLGTNSWGYKMSFADDSSIIGSFMVAERIVHADRWTLSGGFVDLSEMMQHGPVSNYDVVSGLNSSGAIAGTLENTQAYLFQNGTTTYLGTLPGSLESGVRGLSEAGHVVGTNHAGRCFIFKDGLMMPLTLVEGWGDCNVYAVNARGHSVGTVTAEHSYRGVVWAADGSVLRDLGTLIPMGGPTAAIAINERDEVVGAAGARTILISSEGRYVFLDDLVGGTIQVMSPSCLNNRGQVAVVAICADQRRHSLLLTPIR